MQNSIDRRFAAWAWSGAGVAVFVFAVVALTVFGGSRVWTNGKEIRTPASGAPVRRILWLPAQPVAQASESDQYEPKVSADGLTMVFVRRRAGSNADLFEARWTPDGWSEAKAIEAINTEKDELGPELSRDGTRLYFYSDRAEGLGGYDIWVSVLADGKWGTPRNLGGAVNSAANEYGPALGADGTKLYFASNRLRAGETAREADGWAWPATMREERSRHDYDLYRASGAPDGGWEKAIALALLNTRFDEGSPAASPAGDFLYFASDRPGGLGGFDLYRCRVLDERIGVVENLGDAVNSARNDLDAGLSADGFRLYFSSDRAGPGRAGVGGTGEPDRYALWSTASREVFVEAESGNRLAKMWDLILALLPWIGALLLALIPLALLIWMWRNEMWRRRLGRLSLLAQCVLISLLIHAAATAGMAVWKVGSGLADAVRAGGGTRVILSSSGALESADGGVGGQLSAPAMLNVLELPRQALSGVMKPVEAAIAAARPIDVPSGLPGVGAQERMIVREEAGAETEEANRAGKSVPEQASRLSAAIPEAVERASNSEASAERVLSTGVSGAAPIAMGRVRGASVEMPSASASTVMRLESAEKMGTEGAAASERADEGRVHAALPENGAIAQQSGAALPRAASATATEAALTAPGSAGGVRMPGPEVAMPRSIGGRGADGAGGNVALPRSAGESQRMANIEIGKDVAAGESGGGAEGRVEVGSVQRSVSAALPTAAVPSATREASVGESAGRAVRTEAASMAPIGMGSVKGIEGMPLPEGTSGRRAERMSTGGIGGVSEHGGGDETWGTSAKFDPSMLASMPGTFEGSRLPGDVSDPVKPLDTQEQRKAESRGELLARMGGSAETEAAVGRALEWFSKHQEADGRWSGKGFDSGCGGCDGKSEIESDAAMTGIVLLCYLGAGHTHLADGPYRENVDSALKWLVARQAASGDLRRGETMYGQTLSTVALCEALAMTKDQGLTAPARRAVDFVIRAAGRRGASAEDVSVLGWLVMTVESARRAGIAVPRDVFEGAGRWLDEASSAGAPGRYSYARGGQASPAMTAEAMFVQQILGRSRDDARMKQSAEFILSEPPKWDGAAPTYHWYYASLALFQQQGEAWETWNKELSPILVKHQRRDGAAAGSWDPQDEWSRLGGRIYQTAVCTLSLEVYYRYKAE